MTRAAVLCALVVLAAPGCRDGAVREPPPPLTGVPNPTLTATLMPSPTATPTPAPLPSPTPEAAVQAPPTPPPQATQAPPAPTATRPPPPPTQPPAPPPPVSVSVTARNLRFDRTEIRARGGAQVSVHFRNEDQQVAHDLSFNVPGLGHGNTCFGPCEDRYTFTAPASGRYQFFCTVHSDMGGDFIVDP